MQSVHYVVIIISLVAVVAVLAVGLVGMFRNKEFNRKHGNTLMRARVATQLFAVVVIALYYFMY
jgi:hypothetical protein